MISSMGMRRAVAPWLVVLGWMDLGAIFERGGLLRLRAETASAIDRYDPAAVSEGSAAETLELTVTDSGRNRQIPVRVVLPCPRPIRPAPVILFSHGLGGSRQSSQYLGDHWAARGYVVVCPQHHGSDEAVWQAVPPEQHQAVTHEQRHRKTLGIESPIFTWCCSNLNTGRRPLGTSYLGNSI